MQSAAAHGAPAWSRGARSQRFPSPRRVSKNVGSSGARQAPDVAEKAAKEAVASFKEWLQSYLPQIGCGCSWRMLNAESSKSPDEAADGSQLTDSAGRRSAVGRGAANSAEIAAKAGQHPMPPILTELSRAGAIRRGLFGPCPRMKRPATPPHRYESVMDSQTFHSITMSARASSVGGTVRPSALAVIKLIARSNLIGCSTGRSPGRVPRRILSTYSAERRNRSGRFAP